MYSWPNPIPLTYGAKNPIGSSLRCGADGAPVFVEAAVPSDDELHALLQAQFPRVQAFMQRMEARPAIQRVLGR